MLNVLTYLCIPWICVTTFWIFISLKNRRKLTVEVDTPLHPNKRQKKNSEKIKENVLASLRIPYRCCYACLSPEQLKATVRNFPNSMDCGEMLRAVPHFRCANCEVNEPERALSEFQGAVVSLWSSFFLVKRYWNAKTQMSKSSELCPSHINVSFTVRQIFAICVTWSCFPASLQNREQGVVLSRDIILASVLLHKVL